MKSAKVPKRKVGFRDERGAALITVLMIAIPLLMAGGSLILITSMNTANTADMAAETKAYYAAESGAQQVLQVMRGNVAPSPLFASNPSGSIATANLIDFQKAVTQSASNLSTDANGPRLSRWLTYDSTYTDRVPLNSSYSPITGLAFNVQMSDPDNAKTVAFSTSGGFPSRGNNDNYVFTGGSGNQAKISFVGQPATTITATGSSTLGKFVIDPSVSGSVTLNEPFKLVIAQTLPWGQTHTINCTLTGTISSTSSYVVVTFGTLSNNLQGTTYVRSGSSVNSNGSTPIAVTVTAPQPSRLIADISGFGPRSAKKQLKMLLSRFAFDFSPVSTITLRSADNGSVATFSAGSSAVYSYSGYDNAAGGDLPAFGVTSTPDYNMLLAQSLPSGQVVGSPTNIQKIDVDDLPNWLQTADGARAMLNSLRTSAMNNGRYFTPATPPSDFGSVTAPKMTFVDGDADLIPADGAGVLLCTGALTIEGSAQFHGLVLVIGAGSLTRSGGGDGGSYGSVMVAHFGTTGDFLAPTMQANGGGTSLIQYDSAWVRRGLGTPGPRVMAIGEF